MSDARPPYETVPGNGTNDEEDKAAVHQVGVKILTAPPKKGLVSKFMGYAIDSALFLRNTTMMHGQIKSKYGMRYNIDPYLNAVIVWFTLNNEWNNPYSQGGLGMIFYTRPLPSNKFSALFYTFSENSCFKEHKNNLFGLFDPSDYISETTTRRVSFIKRTDFDDTTYYELTHRGTKFIDDLNNECIKDTTTRANIRNILLKLFSIKTLDDKPVIINLDILLNMYKAYMDIYEHINEHCTIHVFNKNPVYLVTKRIVTANELYANTSNLELDRERLCFHTTKSGGGLGELKPRKYVLNEPQDTPQMIQFKADFKETQIADQKVSDSIIREVPGGKSRRRKSRRRKSIRRR